MKRTRELGEVEKFFRERMSQPKQNANKMINKNDVD
jgi:hypothetical protein